MLVTKHLTVAIDFHNIYFYTVEVNGTVSNLVTQALQMIFFCV